MFSEKYKSVFVKYEKKIFFLHENVNNLVFSETGWKSAKQNMIKKILSILLWMHPSLLLFFISQGLCTKTLNWKNARFIS